MGRTGVGRGPRSAAHTAWYSLSCVASALVLAVSCLSYLLVHDVASIGGSHAITGGPSVGAQNILLMGLESRRDWNGNILPDNILKALHAGSRQGVQNGVGGNDTNTLILIHIPAGGKKAVGFSIPRDDWVDFAGTVGPQQQGKIDQAYGVSMYYEQQNLQQRTHISQNRLAFLGNEAGRAAAVATVEKLTGVHVDHFAEVNLDGFYELARVLGGVQVCLKQATYDSNSGADFHAGYQHLNAAQALAFVRQRDGLPNGDLDRTHRQQAFLDSIIQQLRTEGVLSDLSKMQALLSVAKQYVITDSDWNLLDFAANMRDLTGRNLTFRTLPIQGYATIEGQAANAVQPATIQQIVRSAFYPEPSPPSQSQAGTGSAHTTTVDVLNGGDTPGLAASVSAALTRAGYRAGRVSNTSHRSGTTVRYGAGTAAAANGARIAKMLGVTAAASTSVPAGHVEILLGPSATVPSVALATTPSSPTASSTTGPEGAAVGGNGIPCVD